jgi:adenine/guanine phosphoribosyltransferase-like PRPP-binding protein
VSKVHSPSYTEKVFHPQKFMKLVDRTEARIKELQKRTEINALAASGNSGVMLAGALGYILGMSVLVVRKNHDSALDMRKVNGLFHPETKYLIIDDLISSGRTVCRIVNRVQEAANDLCVVARPAGILLYEEYGGGRGRDSFFTEQFESIPCWHVRRRSAVRKARSI